MISNGKAISFSAYKSGALKGAAEIPGDKSISHRALIIGSLAVGETKIRGLLESFDVMSTATAMRSLGAKIYKDNNGDWIVNGVGVGGFISPEDIIDCGNSGTSVRLIMGATSTCDISVTFTGDSSLRSRPMKRIIEPLREFGANVYGQNSNTLPMTLIGAKNPVPVSYISPHASAQVKSAVLLAGLNTPGETCLIEPTLTRDHSERMLNAFGANIKTEQTDKGWVTLLKGYPELKAQNLSVTRDPSSAAFVVCAALIVKGSEIFVPSINLNRTRNGIYEVLIEMGADITFENQREESGEPIADIRARYSPDLKGVDVPEIRAPSMIDEYPILACVAACALGTTKFFGVSELRVKESDRISSVANGLRKCGVSVSETKDTMEIIGKGAGSVTGGVLCESKFDHRIAMSFLCLGLASVNKISVDDVSSIDTSFPTFFSLMTNLGAEMKREVN
jgi:3-phosphoshikimate 1-carboxyvinyltransferase